MSGRPAQLALWAALVAGAAVRAAFLGAKPFWRDEAWVVLLLAEPLAAVTGGRPVPLGFLFAIWPAQFVPLPPELALRWLPLAAGIALVPLVARLATTLGADRWTAVGAAWLAAGLPALVYYARELKPYGLDAFLAVVVPLLAVAGFGVAGGARAARGTLIACLVLAPWLTFGALFPILAVLGWGWLVWWRRAPARERRSWALASLLFAASTASVWAFAWREQVAAPRLREFWSASLFSTEPAALGANLLTATDRYLAVTASYLLPTATLPLLALAAIGACAWPRPQRAFLLWLFAGSAIFCIAAAVTGGYLIAEGRLLLFAAPPLILWIAHGAATLGRGVRAAALGPAALAVLALWWCGDSIAYRLRAQRSDPLLYFRQDVLHDVDALIGTATTLVPPGQPVLVSRYAAYPFQVYARGRLPQAAYCALYCFDDLAFLRDWLPHVAPRGWILLIDEEAPYLARYLEAAGFVAAARATGRGVQLWEIARR